MENISAELEQKIIELIKQNKLLEAVAIVQNELKLGLKISKEIVDKYKLMNKG
jgi:hypothetical protein